MHVELNVNDIYNIEVDLKMAEILSLKPCTNVQKLIKVTIFESLLGRHLYFI